MIKLITFTDDRMTRSAHLCVESARKFGADEYSIWVPGDLSAEFKETMADVLQHERGAGFYCWKPYIVHREMCKLKDGDILVYCDAGNEWIADMRLAVSCMDQDILFFSNGWRHVEWTKGDAIEAILPGWIDGPTAKEGELMNAKQVQASTFFIRVCSETRKFIQEWYAWSLIPGLIDNEPSILPNIATFREHRWDQSILCCMQIKYDYRLHWFPSTMYMNARHEFPDDKYPALLNHHRKRNHEW